MLSVTPTTAMLDEATTIAVRGLRPQQTVTIGAMLRNPKKNGTEDVFVSHAFYQATSTGEIMADKQESLGASFAGSEPMGLFWSMLPMKGQRDGIRFFPANVLQPYIYQFYLIEGHRDPWSKDAVVLHTAECKRYLLAENVSRIEVREGSIRGTLFMPKDTSRRYPGIIDLYGTAGGLLEYRAALLSSKGFAVLALAYFQHDDLPKQLYRLDCTYFEEAIDWMLRQPQIIPFGVGMIGISYGATLGIIMASLTNKVKAVVSINGIHCNDPFFQCSYKGDLLPAPLAADSVDVSNYITVIYDTNQLARITTPVENSSASFLFLCSLDDRSCQPCRTADILVERLRRNGKEKRAKKLEFSEAGHLLEPPYMPSCRMSFHRILGSVYDWGGTAKPHAHAQEQAWSAIIDFFSTSLRNDPEQKLKSSL